MMKPVIFISSVSKELHSARDLVAKTLISLGYEPKWKDVAPTETGDVRAVLRKWVDDCQGVIQIVGQCYGFEPQDADPEFGRCSYTQYEALYARKRGKKVWYIILEKNHPTDGCACDPVTLHEWQEGYREKVKSDDKFYHPSASLQGTENIVLKLRPDLEKLRRRTKVLAALILSLLVFLALGIVWVMNRQGGTDEKISEISGKNDKLLTAMRDLSQTLSQTAQPGAKEDEATRLHRAYASLEEKLKLQPGTLEKELPQFAEQFLMRAGNSALDRANAFFATRRFAEAEAQALNAKDDLLAAVGKPVQDAIKALELAGSAAEAQTQYARSLGHFRAAAALTSQERDPLEWARVQHMIAFVLVELGKGKEGVPILQAAIKERQRLLGPEHPGTLGSRNNLANALFEEGKYAEAEKEHRSVLAIRQRVFGAENPDTLGSRANLANALCGQCRYAEAEKEQRAVLAIYERLLGAEHHDTLRSRHNLAVALYSQGKYVEAVYEVRAVLAICGRVLGPENPLTLASRNNLAEALRAQGKNIEAEKEHRAVLAIHERLLGAEHPATLGSRNNLAGALDGQGKNAEAEKEDRAVLTIRERVLGPEHPDTLTSRNNLAGALQAQFKSAEAEKELRAVLKIRERVLGAEHPDTLTSRNDLAQALQAQGKKADAEKEHRAVLALRERVLGPEHPDTLTSRNNLAVALHDKGKYAEAEKELRAVLAIRERLLGAEHPDVFHSCFNLALCLEAQGNLKEALEFAQRAEKGRFKTLGAEHPYSVKAKRLRERIETALQGK